MKKQATFDYIREVHSTEGAIDLLNRFEFSTIKSASTGYQPCPIRRKINDKASYTYLFAVVRKER
jgi:hypothetical protein